MVDVFLAVEAEVRQQACLERTGLQAFLCQLDRRGRVIYELFEHQKEISSQHVARALSLSPRQARELLVRWLAEGWLETTCTTRKLRRYRLTAV